MSAKRSPIEKAAGRLISAIQKEWGDELGESTAEVGEDVMDKGHVLLQAAKNNEVLGVLKGRSVTQYLGELWVRRHPSVEEFIADFERELDARDNV